MLKTRVEKVLETGCYVVANFPYKLEEITESEKVLKLFLKFARKIGQEPVDRKFPNKERLSNNPRQIAPCFFIGYFFTK